MGKMAIPIEGIGVSAFYIDGYRIARQTMLPENGFLEWLEVGLIPDVGMKLGPTFTPRVEIGFIDGESLWVGLRYKLWLTGNWGDVGWVYRLAKSHVVIASNGVAIRLVVNIVFNLEVHATAHILYYQSIAAGLG